MRKDILNSELIKEIMSIRCDTLWAMLYQIKKMGEMPEIGDEGATSKHDNKGALFVPGGFIIHDSDRLEPKKIPYKSKEPAAFREHIRELMMHDNASLLYHDGFAKGINLDNGLHSELAREIMAEKKAAFKRSTQLNREPPQRMSSDDLVISYCPTYISSPPFGARVKLSSCLAVPFTQPRMYFEKLRNLYSPDKDREKELWDNLRLARKPILSEDKSTVLAQPHLVVCHSQRYKQEIMTGITRIMGYGSKFGEFSTLTLEEVTNSLMKNVDGRTKPRKHEIFAEYDGKKYVGVLRNYPSTTPGKRLQTNQTMNVFLVSPEKDLGMNIEERIDAYMTKYDL